jgi:hypothetical protein
MEAICRMFDYRSEFERRIEQFGRHLKLMHDRAHEEAHGPCFIIFDERRPAGSPGDEDLSEAKKLVLQLVGQAFPDGEIANGVPSDQADTFDLPDKGWRPDDSQNRYIQFSFERNWFCLDMPLETLYRAEAEEILRSRQGFFYLRERAQFTLYGEDVDGHDPFRKIYVYGDEDSAAEDMAFIFFQVWKFPIDSRFYVTAASFNGKCEWERGFPIE